VQAVLENYQDLRRQAVGSRSRSWATSMAQKFRASKISCLGSSVLSGSGALRRRKTTPRVCQQAVSHGFHPLSDPIAAEPAVEELVTTMNSLSEFYNECSRESPSGTDVGGARSSGTRILLLLDECDHLIQQRHFQDVLADVLRRCPSYSIVLSTQQQMVQTGGGWFKVVHQPIGSLAPKDAALLFMRRAHRPLYWDELPLPADDPQDLQDATALSGRKMVVKTKDNEAEVLALVAAHPAVAAQRGNPRRIIELANQVCSSLPSLSDLPVLGKAELSEDV